MQCDSHAMVQNLQWSTLADMRQISRLVMMYHIQYDLIDISWSQYLIPPTSRTRGHASHFLYPQCSSSTSTYSNSFFPHTTCDWNALKSDPVTFVSLAALKTALRATHLHNLTPDQDVTFYLDWIYLHLLNLFSTRLCTTQAHPHSVIYPHTYDGQHFKFYWKEGN